MRKLKIVCLGDSITFGYNLINKKVVQSPNNYPHHLKNLLSNKFDVEVINSGMNGWQIKQANQYLDDLVLVHKPDICFIMYGINDVLGSNRSGIGVSFKYFFEQLNEVVLKLKLRGIKPVVLTPICVDNNTVTELSCEIVNYGILLGVEVIDINTLTRDLIKKRNLDFKEVFPDGIHFRSELYQEIGALIYKSYFKE